MHGRYTDYPAGDKFTSHHRCRSMWRDTECEDCASDLESSETFGLQRARDADVPTAYHNLKKFGEQHPAAGGNTKLREAYDAALADLVLHDQPNLIVCAGWMHVLSLNFLDPLAKAGVPAINLHPALPGVFSGAKAIERAFKLSEKPQSPRLA